MDRITLRNVRAYGRHGVNPGERDVEQAFDVDATLDIDLRDAQRTDELADTLDYAQLRQTIAATVASTSWQLLERLAGEIVDAIFKDARVARAEVTVSKPGVPDGATASVTLIRTNPFHRSAQ